MLRYLPRRLAGAAVVLTLLSFLVFSLLYLVPGDPVKILVGTRRLTPEVRQAVKDYSNWPTIPQLYINGEFIGGVDIMAEMAESGELQKLIPEGNKAA